MYLHTATGGLTAGAVTSIVNAADVFALLNLVVIVVRDCLFMRSTPPTPLHLATCQVTMR